jgi:hypothetical protein
VGVPCSHPEATPWKSKSPGKSTVKRSHLAYPGKILRVGQL